MGAHTHGAAACHVQHARSKVALLEVAVRAVQCCSGAVPAARSAACNLAMHMQCCRRAQAILVPPCAWHGVGHGEGILVGLY